MAEDGALNMGGISMTRMGGRALAMVGVGH